MSNKTSDHVKPCNIGQSEAHNRRSETYLAHISESKIYIRRDLMSLNESWVSEQMEGRGLLQYYDGIARMVKEKTCRAMQTKERKVVNKKTGRVKVISGSSPLRESVVVCKEDTTMEQLKNYCSDCHRRFGITAIQIHIHHDEGHYVVPSDKTSWKPNNHAHIIWDWMNHDTGKSCKLNADDMSLMQDMVSESLDMERGMYKAETGKQHLERNDFIIAKQKKEAELVYQQREEAEQQRDKALSAAGKALEKTAQLEVINQNMRKQSEELDAQRRIKKEAIDNENGSIIMRGLAKFGITKDELVTENKKLINRVSELEQDKKEADKFKDTVNRDFNNQINKRVAERTQQQVYKMNEMQNEIASLKSNRQIEIEQAVELAVKPIEEKASTYSIYYKRVLSKKEGLQIQFNNYKKAENVRLNEAIDKQTNSLGKQIKELRQQSEWKSEALNLLSSILIKIDELFLKAVKVIIHFAQTGFGSKYDGGIWHQDVLHDDEATIIKATMEKYGGNNEHYKDVGKFLVHTAATMETLTESEIQRAQHEVNDVADGMYDHMIAKRGISQ